MLLSVDDGCASDLRLADLCDKYEIDCVFYWPVEWHSLAYDNGYEPLSYDDALEIARRYEIGSHTVTHRHLTKLTLEEAQYEIVASKFMLERLFKKDVTKFAAPRGYTSDELSELTLDFYSSQRLTKGKGLVHVHPNSGANGNKPWVECIDEYTTELWMHSWELNKYDLWDELEEVLSAYTHS